MARKQAVADAIYKSWAIKAASEKAQLARNAEQWLSQYGPNVAGEGDGTVNFRPSYAGSCVGAPEAQAYIQEAMYAMLPQIIAAARTLAVRDLDALLDLVAPDATGARAEMEGE